MANLLGEHRTSVTLVTREKNGTNVTKLTVSSDETSKGIELEECIISELVKNHVW